MLAALSLFSGIGGLDLAAEWAGFQVAAMCESDPFCRAVLAHHWPGVPIFDDVRTLTADSLRRAGIDPGSIDLIHGGFPCNDISCAGSGAGLGTEDAPTDRSGLWYQMLRITREFRPRFMLAENVPALRTRGIDTVLAGLEDTGYTAGAYVVGAWAVGAPHKRDRVFILADSGGGTGEAGRERAGREARADAGRSGAGAGLGDSTGIGQRESADEALAVTDSRQPWCESGITGAGLADALGIAPREHESVAVGWGCRAAESGSGSQEFARGVGLADPSSGGRRSGQRVDDARQSDTLGSGEGMADTDSAQRRESSRRWAERDGDTAGRPQAPGGPIPRGEAAGRDQRAIGVALGNADGAGWEGAHDAGEGKGAATELGANFDAGQVVGGRYAQSGVGGAAHGIPVRLVRCPVHAAEEGAESHRHLRPAGVRWPAGRGEPQKDWEAPRTTPAGAERNREGQLRAYGNSVNPHQAFPLFVALANVARGQSLVPHYTGDSSL